MFFYEWVPVLFLVHEHKDTDARVRMQVMRYTLQPMVLHYSTEKLALQIFYKEQNSFDMFVRPQRCTQCVLMSNTECKHNFSLFTRKLQRAHVTVTQSRLSKLIQSPILFSCHTNIN